ncbi:TnpV protein [Hominenteromicrobium sp.]|uniref:TnpV protein n=1 Tax=Hominenteromicrobium sp. TaxID=3073581 RepID=UPI003A900727
MGRTPISLAAASPQSVRSDPQQKKRRLGSDPEAALFLRLVKQMADAEGITETLKANDQMEWVGRMNSCRDRASETVYHQVIYTVRSHR